MQSSVKQANKGLSLLDPATYTVELGSFMIFNLKGLGWYAPDEAQRGVGTVDVNAGNRDGTG